MNDIDTLHEEIERLSEERADLWHSLSERHDPATAAELKRLDAKLDGLWESAEFMPDKITIFRRPLVASFPDPDELEREIRITVLHELAHYFGIDEDRLAELGYE